MRSGSFCLFILHSLFGRITMFADYRNQVVNLSAQNHATELHTNTGFYPTRGSNRFEGDRLHWFCGRASQPFNSNHHPNANRSAIGDALTLLTDPTNGTINVGSANGAINSLPVRPTSGIGTGVAGGDWFSQSLSDATLSNLTRSFDADGSLSRNDMISLFRATERDGMVSAGELTDLRTIVLNAQGLGIADYVATLADKIVNGSVANATFQGAALGNLYAGSTAQQMEALVEKHFYGQDHLASMIPGDATTPDRFINYGYVSSSLFGDDGAPSITDIHQGYLGDCYFLASLGATALQNPSAIQNMFLDNGDGTFTVRFFGEHNGNVTGADYVTVDRMLPLNVIAGSKVSQFASYDDTNGMWVALAEKAFAQFAEEGLNQRPADTTTGMVANSYASIEGGWGVRTMPAITGTAGVCFADNSEYSTIGNYGGTMLSLTDIAQGLAAGYSLTAD